MPKGKRRARMLERNNAKNSEAKPTGEGSTTPANPVIPPTNPPTQVPKTVGTPAKAETKVASVPGSEQKAPAPQVSPAAQATEKVDEPPKGDGANPLLRFAKKKAVRHTLAPFKVDTTSVKLNLTTTRPRTIYKYDIKIYRVRDNKRASVVLSKEEAMQAMILLRNNPTAQQLMKGAFWYDFKALFYSKYSFEKTTFSITMSDKVYELDIVPTEFMTITDAQSLDERATQALMTSIMYETSVDKYAWIPSFILGSSSV